MRRRLRREAQPSLGARLMSGPPRHSLVIHPDPDRRWSAEPRALRIACSAVE